MDSRSTNRSTDNLMFDYQLNISAVWVFIWIFTLWIFSKLSWRFCMPQNSISHLWTWNPIITTTRTKNRKLSAYYYFTLCSSAQSDSALKYKCIQMSLKWFQPKHPQIRIANATQPDDLVKVPKISWQFAAYSYSIQNPIDFCRRLGEFVNILLVATQCRLSTFAI